MSDEHTQHRQCQTCFVDFPTHQELFDHVEEYRFRERLLVAELERCRMHIAVSSDLNGENDDDDADEADDDNYDGEDYEYEPAARPGPLQCPFAGCARKEPYTTRGNLVRHFQRHIRCYEMCPSCHEIIRQVHRFTRHDCKTSSDPAKNVYFQQRITQLNGTVSKELDRLQKLQSNTRKRERGAADSDVIQMQKRVKMTRDSALLADTALQSHLPVDCSIATNGGLACPADTSKVTATNNTEWEFAETMVTSSTETTVPAETATSMRLNDARWAFPDTAAVVPANDGGWAFGETASAVPADDGGWAFAETAAAIPGDDGGWAFAETAPAVSADEGGWAFAETVTTVNANNPPLTLPAEATAGSMVANNGEWAVTRISDVDERPTITAMGNGIWALTEIAPAS